MELEHSGDIATSAKRHDLAIAQFSAVLALDPASASQGILTKWSKAYVAGSMWGAALHDVNEVCSFL